MSKYVPNSKPKAPYSCMLQPEQDISDVYMIESNLRGQMDDIFGEVEAAPTVSGALKSGISLLLLLLL